MSSARKELAQNNRLSGPSCTVNTLYIYSMGRISILLLLLSLPLFSCEVVLGTVTGNNPKIEVINNSDTAVVRGVLGKRFYKKFQKFAVENPNVRNLVLQDIPGSLNDDWNVKSCTFLHENCFNTHVNDSSMIASGGVDLFIAGNSRSVSPKAKIGVHSWRDLKKDGSEYPRDSEEHKVFLDFFEVIEMDTAFYWYTLKASPGKSIHWMTWEEIEKYQLIETVDSTNTCY